MKRNNKYPDTSTFHYHNENPKGRITGDCAYRALAAGTGISYNEVVMGLAKVHCETGYEPTEGRGLDAYMKSIGWVKHKQPRKWDNTKYTGKEFCEELNFGYEICESGSIVANIGGHHMVAIKEIKCEDGAYRYKVHDIWDSTNGCIGNYWTKG